MNVLLYSHAFHPSTGGVETVSMQLAEGFVRRGIACKVVTRTERASGHAHGFEVIESPGRAEIRQLLEWADVVLFNGASLALQPDLLLSRKPFVWVHVGYQAACIDGAGWHDGAPAPRTPWASIRHHAPRLGAIGTLREAVKLGLRRFVARHLVTRNVAITHWMDRALPLPRQVHIYNPFPTRRFEAATDTPDHEFLYLGRLVSEKGVDTLLEAFAKVLAQQAAAGRAPARLLIVGDGDRRGELEALADELGVAAQTRFVGAHSGAALVEQVSRGRIAIVPSAWAEPMGGVVVELMAAGRNLIVSQEGGLAEGVGDAGLTFPNRDADALAQRMVELLDDPLLQREQAVRARARALEFEPEAFIDQYVVLLREIAPAAQTTSTGVATTRR